MRKINVPVLVSFKGGVLTLEFRLEGREVSLAYDGTEWSRSIPAFPVEFPLDVYVLCKGITGTKWELKLTVDGQEMKPIKGEVKKGYSSFSGPAEPAPPKVLA